MAKASSDTPSVRVEASRESAVRHRLEIEVDARQVSKAFDRAYKDLAKRAQVRGFRKGKVPRSMLVKLYGPSVAEDLQRVLVAESLPDAVAQADVTPVAEPGIDAAAPVEGEAYRYVAEIETKPEIELGEIRGLPAKRPAVELDETEVLQQLEALRTRQAPVVEEPEETPLRNGHIATIDFEGKIDGEAFEGGAGKEVQLEIGEGRMIPGFEDQLLGAKAGEQVEIRVTFPDDYGNTELAGKEAVFDTQVRDIRRRDLPELDDEFAKDVGDDFETLDALRDHIRGEMKQARDRQADAALRESLLDALLERHEIDVPPGMVDRALDQRLQSAHRRFEGQVPEEALHGQLARWREEWRPDAEREVRASLLLDAVADAEGIEVDDAAVQAHIAELAEQQGIEAPRLAKAYEDAGVIEGLRAELRETRAVDFLRAEAKIEEISEP